MADGDLFADVPGGPRDDAEDAVAQQQVNLQAGMLLQEGGHQVVSGRLALMGDAAFVVRPYTAMGVAKAAGDAMALRAHLGRLPPDEALRAFERERMPVGAATAAHGRRLGAELGRDPEGAACRAGSARTPPIPAGAARQSLAWPRRIRGPPGRMALNRVGLNDGGGIAPGRSGRLEAGGPGMEWWWGGSGRRGLMRKVEQGLPPGERLVTEDIAGFSATQRDAAGGAPGATAAFPYDRMTVERFREAFPRARWRDDLGAWFVPGTRAERRLTAWMGREWSGVLAYADQRGRDAFAFEPIASPYLEVAEDIVVRTPYSRAVIAELREVPWARWDPASKAWRVPFRSFEELRKRWPAIEVAAQLAEPEERRKRERSRKASPEHEDRRAEAVERRRHRYPVPEDALPPTGRVLMTHAGCVVFEEVTGELVEPAIAARFYPDVTARPAALVWAAWRRPSHAELVQAWPARTPPDPTDLARGWWQPAIEVLREERRKAASIERGRATRRSRSEN